MGARSAPNLQYRVYGKYFDRDSTVLPDGRDASDDWHMGQGGFRMDWDASESNVFTVQGDGYDGRISQAGADEIDVSGANVIGRWSHTFYEGSDLTLQLYYDRTHREHSWHLFRRPRHLRCRFPTPFSLGRAARHRLGTGLPVD